MSKSSGKSTIIIIRQEDLPAIRKKQAPPAKIMRDRTAYRRKDKHAKRGDGSGQDKTPGWDIPPGVLHFFRQACIQSRMLSAA